MSDIPEDHPRRQSLITRERVTQGVASGITSINGLIAQGRGEAFDYLLGEVTIPSAFAAERAAAALLLLASRPVISVNGNSAALVPDEMVELSGILGAPLEVNLFYRSDERVLSIIDHLENHGAGGVLGARPDAVIEGLSSERGKVCSEGIYPADVVFVPLEDGDRCEALAGMGKQVVAVDLNPLSRTAQRASVTIVDNITRALPNIIHLVRELQDKPEGFLQEIVDDFDNRNCLEDALVSIHRNLTSVNQPQ